MSDKAKIIIVDDIASDLFMLGHVLSSLDFVEIIEVDCGRDALIIAESTDNIALLLLDIMMSGIDGYEVAKRMHENERTKNIPIIFITSKIPNDSDYKYSPNIVDYITKPFINHHVISKVRVFTKIFYQKQELLRLKAQAEEVNLAKSHFISNISHDIRTPLNAVIGMSEVMLENETDKEKSIKLKAIFSSGKTLMCILNDVIDISKIESSNIELNAIKFDMFELVQDIAEIVAINAYDKNIEFALHYKINTPQYVIGDPDRIKQILFNLVGNAIKFTKEGGVSLTISAESTDNNEYMFNIDVKDTGLGISEDMVDRIFLRFEKVNSSSTREFSGSGLGLAISKDLLQMMGGGIDVTSTEGKGSCFSINFKLLKDEGNRECLYNHSKSLNDVKILIVDDSKLMCEMISFMLKDAGAQVGYVTCGYDAIKKLGNAVDSGNPYNVTLIDYVMDEMNGLEVGNMIKAMPQIQDVNLIMMTAYTYKIDDHDFKDSGFVDTVSKPVDSKVIFRKIRNAIGQEEGLYTSDDKSISDDNQVSYEGVNILVVDDTEVNCLIMEHMLSSMGCEVTICVNGLEALELAKKNKYDLILLDWQMPVMDGPTAARNITEWANENNQYLCPIITFTANINIGDENQLLANGIKDFMSKPIHKSDIISIFNKWL